MQWRSKHVSASTNTQQQWNHGNRVFMQSMLMLYSKRQGGQKRPKNLAICPNWGRNQEWLCWRGPAVIYWTGQDWIRPNWTRQQSSCWRPSLSFNILDSRTDNINFQTDNSCMTPSVRRVIYSPQQFTRQTHSHLEVGGQSQQLPVYSWVALLDATTKQWLVKT
jgi:hypothetical protein